MTHPQKTRKTRRSSAARAPQERPIVYLRQERQRRGLRREDIKTGARIPLKYITMLETGQYPEQIDDQLKAKIKAYRKAYLRYLGLPSNARLKLKKQSTIAAAVQEVTSIFSKTDSLPQSGFFKTLIYSFIGIVFVLSLVQGISAVFKNQDQQTLDLQSQNIEDEKDAEEPPQAKDIIGKMPIQKSFMDWLLRNLSTTPTTQAESQNGALRPNVKIRILEPVHLKVVIDGRLDFKRFVNPIQNTLDREFSWEYGQEVSITVNDISSVAIQHNDHSVEPMGDVGSRRTITFRNKRID